jgi:peptidoglycan/xylan/chitin deacetylase (PgdA/CDA1 family)/glycosyltransferase involved in cell wall biosynthesis/SAM-dependent methyltransferase
MTGGRIAAVITCRNLGRFLDDALESVERQTRLASEILVVDDASTDLFTRQTLVRLEREGTRVVDGDGRGASAARNLGAELTSSDYLAWLDADDALEPGYFEAAAAALDSDESLDFVSCAMRAFGAASYVWTPAPTNFVDAVATGGVPHASTMMRRSLWERAGRFDETLVSFELLDFWASALERGARGIVLEQPMLNYRVRHGSGYRRSIQDGTYRARLEHVYAKHRHTIDQHWSDLMLAKEAFVESQREHRRTLENRAAALEAELSQLKNGIADLEQTLDASGLSRVAWGDLAGTAPISPLWGRDRGTPIDRYYIEHFLDRHRGDIRGRVLEVREPMYTERFGGGAVSAADVIDCDPANPRATIVADLRDAKVIADAAYDCVILTHTLQLIDDPAAAVAECARMLRPGGVLLATAPTVNRVDVDAGVDGDFWRLTEASGRRLLAAEFPLDAFEVVVYGNVKVCTAFLQGLSVQEMTTADLDHHDPAFPLVVAMRAVKATDRSRVRIRRSPANDAARVRGVIVSYHRIATLSPDSHALCTPADVFRAQMTCLRDRFTPIALEDLVQAAAAGSIPEGAVAVTLDDGYLDALTTASPILLELGIPATFFVNGDRLDQEHERWWDILEHIFACQPLLPPTLTVSIGAQELRAPTSSVAARVAAVDRLNRAAWPLDGAARRRLLDDVVAWSRVTPHTRSTHRVLTGAEICALADRPAHTIGAHTTNHLALTAHGAETKRLEIVEDKTALERLLGQAVRLFAYPYGDFDASTVAAVRDAGFHAAVTVEAGPVAAGANRLLLPRVEMMASDHDRFERRLKETLGQT